MPILTTCPDCNYERQPTDCAPDWACPRCHKAYVKTILVNAGCCKNHPSEKAIWRCNDCGKEYCTDCVQPIRQSKPFIFKPIPTALCTECKGVCIDFRHAERLADEQIARDKHSKNQFYLALIFVTLSILSFPVQYYWGKGDGAADARRELPKLAWHELDLYGPQIEPPQKFLPVVTHDFRGRRYRLDRLYIQGYVVGHNEVVLEQIAKNKKLK